MARRDLPKDGPAEGGPAKDGLAEGGLAGLLRVRPGTPIDLAEHDPAGMPAGPRDRVRAAEAMQRIGEQLDVRQQALYAENTRRVLVVLQGMDTAGKGGVIRRVGGLMNPQGLTITAFRKPSPQEQRHHFLWRIRKAVPATGQIGIFDRSHYEDVMTVRVERLVTESVWRPRFAEINAFERDLAEQATTVVKFFLHLSWGEQRKRLLARLDDPHKQWKFDPADLVARRKWDEYHQAYAEALQRCSTPQAPWYVVPADRKWYRNWCVAQVLLETLDELDPQFPPPQFDVEAVRAALLGQK